MTFDEIVQRIGKNVKYYNDTSGWVANRDLTQQDIEEYVNEVFLEEQVPLYMSRWPHVFRRVTKLDSWIMSAVVDPATTSTTLVIKLTGEGFSEDMEGLWVYNENEDEKVKITDYINETQVTVSSSIAGWSEDDEVFVLGQEFPFNPDVIDPVSIEAVSFKYTSEATYFTRSKFADKQDLFYVGNEVGSSSAPDVYLTTITKSINGCDTDFAAIGILPAYDKKLSGSILVSHTAKPKPLSGSAVPLIPITESLITGGTMKAFERKNDYDSAVYWYRKYDLAAKRDISRYRPITANTASPITVNRNVSYMLNRSI